ncbi:MAG: DUF86 domain-containing protein [Patescibacteria group bacterium]
MTINKELIIQKISQAEENLSKAREILAQSDGEILKNDINLSALERYFQLTVDAILGANNHIIKETDLRLADDLQSTFYILADGGILPKEFAQKIAPVVGLRNLLIHQYEKVDNKQFLNDFRKHNSDFDDYFKHIVSYLDKK